MTDDTNVTDMFGNRLDRIEMTDDEDGYDTYQIRFWDIDEATDLEYVHTVYIKGDPLMSSSFIAFTTDGVGVERLIPTTRLISMCKGEGKRDE